MFDEEEKPSLVVTVLEYGCILALILMVVIVILALFGPAIANVFGLGLVG